MRIVKYFFFTVFKLWPALVVAIFPIAALCEVLASAPVEVNSRYQRTVLYLQDSSEPLRAAFAAAALTALAEIYIAEADLARKQALQEDGKARLMGWSRAVDQYAIGLSLLLEDVEQGFPVELLVNTENVTVTVAGRAVILSHPRADQQTAFEQRLLQGFCQRHSCKELTMSSTGLKPIPVSASKVKPQWLFTDNGPVCTHGSVRISFAGTQNLAHSRGMCVQVLQELMSLVTELAWQRRHQVHVDWDSLSVRQTPGSPEHLVQLNTAGDSILVTIPVIYGSGNLLEHIKPWLQGQLTGAKSPIVQLDARHYGWHLVAE